MNEQITGTIKSVKERMHKGGKYYRVIVVLTGGGEYSFEASVQMIRKYVEDSAKDSPSDLVGQMIVLREKK